MRVLIIFDLLMAIFILECFATVNKLSILERSTAVRRACLCVCVCVLYCVRGLYAKGFAKEAYFFHKRSLGTPLEM